MNSTIEKFGYPTTLIKEYENWVVCLRPVQITLGSLVLACKEDTEAFGSLSKVSISELGNVITDIEHTLNSLFDYDKINYLMLMMLDPHVHFHVIPRFANARAYEGTEFKDVDWPAPPDLLRKRDINADTFQSILNKIKDNWN